MNFFFSRAPTMYTTYETIVKGQAKKKKKGIENGEMTERLKITRKWIFFLQLSVVNRFFYLNILESNWSVRRLLMLRRKWSDWRNSLMHVFVSNIFKKKGWFKTDKALWFQAIKEEEEENSTVLGDESVYPDGIFSGTEEDSEEREDEEERSVKRKR